MSKKYKFPSYVTIKDRDDNVVSTILTQVYQTGIYVCASNKTAIPDQYNFTPSETIKFMTGFKPNNLKDGYTVKFGKDRIVTKDKDGFWIEEPIKT